MKHQTQRRKYKQNFDLLFAELGLGNLLAPPKQIAGGLSHRMFKIETDQGQYAVKALNPEIMQRPTAFNNFITSEKIARLAKENDFPAIPAIEIDGNVIHNVEGQNYMVFPWFDGLTLGSESITLAHCETIGKTLAKLHSIDFSRLNLSYDFTNSLSDIDWEKYANEAEAKNLVWAVLLKDNLHNLYKCCELVKCSATSVRDNMVISHRDFDYKNILWNLNQAYVIDWESAGLINPVLELVDVACNWSGCNDLDLDEGKFISVVNSYHSIKRIPEHINWQTILENNLLGKIEWLEYNIQRSLGLKSADKEEKNIGTQEILNTIPRIIYYAEMMPTIEKCLKQPLNRL